MELLIKLLPYMDKAGFAVMVLGTLYWLGKHFYPNYMADQRAERAQVRESLKDQRDGLLTLNREQREGFLEALAEERKLNQENAVRMFNMLEKQAGRRRESDGEKEREKKP